MYVRFGPMSSPKGRGGGGIFAVSDGSLRASVVQLVDIVPRNPIQALNNVNDDARKMHSG